MKPIDLPAPATIQEGGKHGYWFTTLEQVAPNTAQGKLWTRAVDLYAVRYEKLISLASSKRAGRVSLADALGRNDV